MKGSVSHKERKRERERERERERVNRLIVELGTI